MNIKFLMQKIQEEKKNNNEQLVEKERMKMIKIQKSAQKSAQKIKIITNKLSQLSTEMKEKERVEVQNIVAPRSENLLKEVYEDLSLKY